MISFLEQENQELNVKQPLLENHEAYIGKEDIKGKAVMDAQVSDEHRELVARKRPRTKGLKRAFQQQRERMTYVDLIAIEINEYG